MLRCFPAERVALALIGGVCGYGCACSCGYNRAAGDINYVKPFFPPYDSFLAPACEAVGNP